MISKLSSWTVKWLLHAGAISENDKELYEYAAYSFLFSLLPLCLVAAIGGISGMFTEGIVMILPFMLIRKFSGGYHLKSPALCFVSSTALLSAFLIIVKIISASHNTLAFSALTILTSLQIFLCSPIDNEARKLSDKETQVFKAAARVIVATFLAVYFVLLLLGLIRFSIAVGSGIIITALLQLPCFIAKIKSKA